MGRTIVICSDGTGNTFDRRTTNVTKLIRMLDLADHRRQVAVYAQGVGTNGLRRTEVGTVPADPKALLFVDPPAESSHQVLTLIARTRGLLFGYGIRATVR